MGFGASRRLVRPVRPRLFRRLQLAAASLILTTAAVAGSPQAGAVNPLLNRPAPGFVRNDLAGRPVRLSALRGHVVLLNFWATWCGPCLSETPRFISLQRRYGRAGLAVIGVSMDDDAAPVRAFQRRLGVPYPLIMGDEKLGLLYGGVLGLPTTYLIDRKGIIRARLEGEADPDELETSIRKLLEAPDAPEPTRRSTSTAHGATPAREVSAKGTVPAANPS